MIMGNNSDFEIENGILTKYWGYEEYVSIPDNVKSIEEKAFIGCDDLQKVMISVSVTRVGKAAFQWYNGIKGIVIKTHMPGLPVKSVLN